MPRSPVGEAILVQREGVSAGAQDSRHRAVDALFEEFNRPGSPGVAVGIYHRAELLYAQGYGLADLEHKVPITAQTVFNVASVSKQFTAFAIALLAREGKLDLQADIRCYLPWMPNLGHRITVDHLVHHTGGLREYLALARLVGHNDYGLITQQHALQLIRRQRGSNFAPGTEYAYSNTGYVLLAEIVQAVSGQSLRSFLEERIFHPLGMTRTRVRDDLGEIVPNYAEGYDAGAGGRTWSRAPYNRVTFGAGNVLSTVEDLGRWARNFGSPIVGDRALIGELFSPGHLQNGTPVNYGFGLYYDTFAGHRAILHAGGLSGFNAVFAYFPEEDFALIILANVPLFDRPRGSAGFLETLARLYLGNGRLSSTPREPAVVDPGAAGRAALAGHYQSRDGRMFALEPQGWNMIWHDAGSGRERGPLTFWADGTFGLESYQEDRFRPVRTAAGEVTALEEINRRTGAARSDTRHARVTPLQASAATLQDLAGDYLSTEIDTRYTLSVESGRLALRSLWLTEPQFLAPATRDRFDAAEGPLSTLSLTVQRDADGAPTGLVFHYPGVRRLLLSKLPVRTDADDRPVRP